MEKCMCIIHYCVECAVAIRLEDIGGRLSHCAGRLATTPKMSEVSVEQPGLWRRAKHRQQHILA